jgi:hypothetical protein
MFFSADTQKNITLSPIALLFWISLTVSAITLSGCVGYLVGTGELVLIPTDHGQDMPAIPEPIPPSPRDPGLIPDQPPAYPIEEPLLDGDTSTSSPGGTAVACTMDAKICPDGSAVGRIGPDCAFAPCPK